MVMCRKRSTSRLASGSSDRHRSGSGSRTRLPGLPDVRPRVGGVAGGEINPRSRKGSNQNRIRQGCRNIPC